MAKSLPRLAPEWSFILVKIAHVTMDLLYRRSLTVLFQVLTAILLMSHICDNVLAYRYSTTGYHQLMPLLSNGTRGGPRPEMSWFKPDSATIESSYWLPARRPAPSFYGQVATAPWIVELSQHPWRGTFLAIATAIALR